MSKYVGISILEVNKLNYLDYLLFRRDAFINAMNQTEEGRNYLDNAYRLEQTAPDREKLREKFGKEG